MREEGIVSRAAQVLLEIEREEQIEAFVKRYAALKAKVGATRGPTYFAGFDAVLADLRRRVDWHLGKSNNRHSWWGYYVTSVDRALHRLEITGGIK